MTEAPYKADLHQHSTCSDGKLTPSELVHRARNYGLSCIAITDHDTMEGVDEAMEVGLTLGVEVIPAVEVTSTFDGKECHILCYGIDPHNQDWRSLLSSQQRLRHSRASGMLEKLADMGIYLSLDDVTLQEADVITRPHIAQALVKAGHATHTKDAFDRFIGNMAPAYVPLYHIHVGDLIKRVHRAGGVATLAHPGTHYSQAQLDALVLMDIDGFEYLHPSHGYALQTKYRDLAEQHGLIVSAGSDFHGFRFQDYSYYGYIVADLDVVTQMKNRCEAIKSAFLAIES